MTRGNIPIRRKTTGMLIVTLLVGLLIGTTVGNILGVFLPDKSVVEKVLVNSYTYVLPPLTLNLIVLTITFGFSVRVNLTSIIGLVVAWYYFKYFY
ncbi:MAG TPA: DUF4321 domain-containing protein [Candidatus Latescibacteria bacterium]|nr:DUF4321 domain-containing protein [Candidatus Latescibacterota bacterium]